MPQIGAKMSYESPQSSVENDVVLSLRVPAYLRMAVRLAAREEMQSGSAVIRQALVAHLKSRDFLK
jgi:hypothetical protein